MNGLSWKIENWGTKWNAYNGSYGTDSVYDMAFLVFDTAWRAPRPIMAAFCNRFQIPFEHRYFDEGYGFWGIEKWDRKQFYGNRIVRVSKSYKQEADFVPLCLELKGYDPMEES